MYVKRELCCYGIQQLSFLTSLLPLSHSLLFSSLSSSPLLSSPIPPLLSSLLPLPLTRPSLLSLLFSPLLSTSILSYPILSYPSSPLPLPLSLLLYPFSPIPPPVSLLYSISLYCS